MTDKLAHERIDWLKEENKELRDKYWVLWHRIDQLQKHLGLQEQEVPKHTILVKREV